MLHGPLVILHTSINEGVVSVQDNVIFYNIFPIVSLSLKGNQASSTFWELTQPTEEAFIKLLTMTPNLFPPRSLRAHHCKAEMETILAVCITIRSSLL